MKVNLNSWDYYELEKEIAKSNVAQLLEIYKRENEKYMEECSNYVKLLSSLNEEGKSDFEKRLEFLDGSRLKVALSVAEVLTKVN